MRRKAKILGLLFCFIFFASLLAFSNASPAVGAIDEDPYDTADLTLTHGIPTKIPNTGTFSHYFYTTTNLTELIINEFGGVGSLISDDGYYHSQTVYLENYTDKIRWVYNFEIDTPYTSTNKLYYDLSATWTADVTKYIQVYLFNSTGAYTAVASAYEYTLTGNISISGSTYIVGGKIRGIVAFYTSGNSTGLTSFAIQVDQLCVDFNDVSETVDIFREDLNTTYSEFTFSFSPLDWGVTIWFERGDINDTTYSRINPTATVNWSHNTTHGNATDLSPYLEYTVTTYSNSETNSYSGEVWVRFYDPLGVGLVDEVALIYVDGSVVRNGFEVTSTPFNLTVADYFGNALYQNTSEEYEQFKAIELPLYEIAFFNDDDKKDFVLLLSSSGTDSDIDLRYPISQNSDLKLRLYSGSYYYKIKEGDIVYLDWTLFSVSTGDNKPISFGDDEDLSVYLASPPPDLRPLWIGIISMLIAIFSVIMIREVRASKPEKVYVGYPPRSDAYPGYSKK